MAIRKVLSAKKVPVKKPASKEASLKTTSTVKVKAKKEPIQKKPKGTKASTVKTKAGKRAKKANSKIDAARPLLKHTFVDKLANKKTALPKGATAKKSSHKKMEKAKVKTVGSQAATQLNAVKKKMVASTAVAKADVSKPANWMVLAEKKIAGIRNEFKKALKAEVAAAFDVCLAAMENAANLMESRLVTVLGEMSNLVTGAKPDFKDGKLKSVVSDDGAERTDFSYGNDGLVTSHTYRSGKLKFEIVHGKLGNPISGKMFDPSGQVVKEFSYGPDGQVK